MKEHVNLQKKKMIEDPETTNNEVRDLSIQKYHKEKHSKITNTVFAKLTKNLQGYMYNGLKIRNF